MRYTKTKNIYKISRFKSLHESNILGVSFSDNDKDKIEIIQWELSQKKEILTSKAEVLEQVTLGLKLVNKSLNTSYKLSKIYFVASDSPNNSVYTLLISKLIRYYHSGKKFEESN